MLHDVAPPSLQESYDNVGLIVGDANCEATGALITLDVTEDVINEAIERDCNIVVAHHPIIMGGIKRLTGGNYVERTVIKAIKHDIAIFAGHTNFDNVGNGVNAIICRKLQLKNTQVLAPIKNNLLKLITYVPLSHQAKVQQALFDAGAGKIGNYDSCSFNATGEGTFKALEGAQPFVGEVNELHKEEELKIETVLPKYLKQNVIDAMLQAHPYEEVAYDIYQLENDWVETGGGMIGELEMSMDEMSFLKNLKETFRCGSVKYTALLNKPIAKVAVCGGAGSFLLNNAKAKGADIFITGDFKYHQFFDAENKLIIADIGHFESEQFTKELFFEILTKKMPNFAVYLSNVNTNPIKYL